MSPAGRIGLFNRLHFRIAAFVITTILVIFGLFMIYQMYWYRRELNHLEMESSAALCQTLTSSLEIAMLNKDREAIQHSFRAVSGHAHILRVFLLDTSGTVRASSLEDMVGVRYRKSDDGCRNCHGEQVGDARGTIVTTRSDQILRVVAPIDNKPACHACHGSSARLNGLLVMDRSLDPLRSEILSNLRLAGIAAGIAVLLMMFVFRWYIKRQVINRVVYLESLARRVASNELNVDIELGGQDELASLARSVDNMKTSLKSSIDQIANHRNYLANLLENLDDGILILDDGVVVFANHAMARILGVDDSVFGVGKQLAFDRAPLDRVAQIDAMIGSAQATKQPIKEAISLRDRGQEEKHLEIHIGQLVLPPKRRPEMIIVIRDITTRVTAENQVYQSERLATVGRLAAGIAHEINNPMASILTCTEGLLRAQGSGGEGRHEYLQVIKNSAQRCRMITQKLLDYSAASAPTMDPVNLGDVLQESVALLQFEAGKKHVALTIEKAAELPLITGAKDSLVQVFVNLILNSIQAVDDGGHIQVVVGVNKSAVDVLVNDDGPGIPSANLSRIFDPFFTTKPVGMGTGLGLSVSQGIVKHHGGTIEVVESGKGRTSVRVSLPILHAEATARNE